MADLEEQEINSMFYTEDKRWWDRYYHDYLADLRIHPEEYEEYRLRGGQDRRYMTANPEILELRQEITYINNSFDGLTDNILP